MTLARTVSDVLSEHVTFEVECIDRMYLNVYVPQLQYPAGIVGYVHRQLGLPIASTAPLAKMTDAFGSAVHRFAAEQGVPWVDFVKGQRKGSHVNKVRVSLLARFVWCVRTSRSTRRRRRPPRWPRPGPCPRTTRRAVTR